jgi:exosortase E/protease (VPEID-CTERM system)
MIAAGLVQVNDGGAGWSHRVFWLPYRICLLTLLIVELACLAPPFDTSIDLARRWPGSVLFTVQHGLRPSFITGLVALALFAWPPLTDELRQFQDAPGDRKTALKWLMVHGVVIIPLVIGSALKRPGRIGSTAEGVVWVSGWFTLGAAALISLVLALLPIRFWRTWLKRRRNALLSAASVGVAAYLLGSWCQSLWVFLQRGTFAVVVLLLEWVGLVVQVDPAQSVISTTKFAVEVGPLCSGIEGIGLVAVCLSVYLWLYRAELRFPQAWLLLPLGILSIWFLNGVRIAALVVIGEWAPDVAVSGFHSVAGWLFFNLVVGCLIWAGQRFQLFRRSDSRIGPSSAGTNL